nr:MAG TPA: hypothetical protein [Caudoviricetes sp.]
MVMTEWVISTLIAHLIYSHIRSWMVAYCHSIYTSSIPWLRSLT